MGIAELIILSIGLAMDAFAVSICKGISMKKMDWKKAIIIGLWFGAFQAIMPLIGYLLGSTFEQVVKNVDHWLAFILLSAIGANMIKESFSKDTEDENDDISVKAMFILAVATSIDALAVGITFAFLKVSIVPSIIIIGLTTFIISVGGVVIGNKFGSKYKSKAEIAGGIILVLIGLKILLEGVGILK